MQHGTLPVLHAGVIGGVVEDTRAGGSVPGMAVRSTPNALLFPSGLEIMLPILSLPPLLLDLKAIPVLPHLTDIYRPRKD